MRVRQASVQPTQKSFVERLHRFDALRSVAAEVEEVVAADVENDERRLVRDNQPVHVVDDVVHLGAAEASLHDWKRSHVAR